MIPAEPFDRALRRRRRDRSVATFAHVAPLHDAVAAEIADRAQQTGRRFARALDLGSRDRRLDLPADHIITLDPAPAFAPDIVADEDRLPFAPGAFDLVASAAALHAVNDLPGCLAQIRRTLTPGGLFIAAFPGGETLRTLRDALLEADTAILAGVTPRVHPMVDAREAAGLLQRAGFVDPVVDVFPLRARFADLAALVRDLRAGGETNILHARDRRPLARGWAAAAAAAFAARADPDGRIAVIVEILHLHGTAPAI